MPCAVLTHCSCQSLPCVIGNENTMRNMACDCVEVKWMACWHAGLTDGLNDSNNVGAPLTAPRSFSVLLPKSAFQQREEAAAVLWQGATGVQPLDVPQNPIQFSNFKTLNLNPKVQILASRFEARKVRAGTTLKKFGWDREACLWSWHDDG